MEGSWGRNPSFVVQGIKGSVCCRGNCFRTAALDEAGKGRNSGPNHPDTQLLRSMHTKTYWGPSRGP